MKKDYKMNIKAAKKKRSEHKSKKVSAFRKRATCVIVATVMAIDTMSIMPFSDLNINLPKLTSLFSRDIEATAATVSYNFDNDDNEYNISNAISITSAAEFCKFSCWYNTYADSESLNNSCVILDLQLNGANFWDLYSHYTYQYNGSDTDCQFYSLGTEDNPFHGKIKITGTNVNQFYSPVPLFDYVDQRTTIVDGYDAAKNIKLLCCEKDGETQASSVPLLANYVSNPTGQSTAFSAEVTLGYFDPTWNEYTNSIAKDFAGIIGETGTGSDDKAKVALTVTNNANGNSNVANVSKSGTVGLLCQKVNSGSTLNATINTGSNTNYTVNATANYNAGGLVGELASGSSLTVSGTGLNSTTQTITGNYAGGIVGYAEDAYIDSEITDSDNKMTVNSSFKASSTSIAGTKGSGYLFGYYKNTSENGRTIILSSFTGLSVSATNNGNAGGLIGVFEHKPTTAGATFTIDGSAGVAYNASITENLTVTLPNNKANCGGLIGKYTTDDLTNTLDITDVYAMITNGNQASTGGIIGYADDTASAAYIRMTKIYSRRTNNSTSGGGLIGTAGGTNGKGAFLDVSGYVKIHGKFSGGLVHTIKYGVVRMEGITDLSSLSDEYYIVNTRDSALIYSPGTGEQTGTSSGEWRLLRNDHKSDDIGSWGEVVRLNDFTANAVIDESRITSDHYVSVNDAVKTNISTVQDFVLLALNIQHNTSNKSAALVLKDTTNTSSSLLNNTSSISLANGSSIDLSGTGITGLTRDNSDQVFKGSLNGNSSTITLAIGEAYGLDSSGSEVSNNTTSNSGTGRIYNHGYNGLFSKTNGASISNLTVTGTQWLGLNSGMYFGGISAQSEGGDSFDTVNSSVTLKVKRNGDNVRILAGGFIGRTNTSASGSITFENCAATASFRDDTWQNDEKAESHFGGYIGLVDAGTTNYSPLTISFGTNGGTNTCSVGGSYVNTTASLNSIYGGLIGTVKGNNTHTIYNAESTPKAYRTINAYGVTVNDLSIDSQTNTASGGLLGYAWHDAEVDLQNVTVGDSSTNTVGISSGTGTKLAGLVYNATGHWTVENVSIDNVTYTTPNASSSLGLLVNSTVNECRLNIDNTTSSGYAQDKQAGLLLEIKNKANYIVDSTGGLNIDNDVTVFDEIAAFSKNPDTSINDIAANGNSIISINIDDSGTGINMTGSACNTYQNQSVYGKETQTVNSNTRYYYNLYTLRTKENPSQAEQVLLWSVYNYAHGTAVKSFFSDWSSVEISGSLDMDGLSYYPIDAFKNIGNVSKLKFYNYEIETAEGLNGNGNSDGVTRSTTSTSEQSQHYMMHCGLFRNVAAGASAASLSLGNIVIEGNVGIPGSGSGFLVCGTLGGSTGVTTFGNSDSNTITLKAAYVNGASGGDSAPMLIANVDSNVVLNINGVKSEGYNSLTTGTWYAATSLIGAVGQTDGSSKNMKLNFSGITLDSRKQNIPSADNARLSNVYGSTRTIFKTATLLGHYYFDTSTDTDSEGIYNFTYDEDWGTENVNDEDVAKHQVTYGQEISSSHEYDNKQEKYYGSTHYADPTTDNNTSGEYDFSTTVFLPYVGNYNNADANYHELKVNHSVVDLTNGCGTYNDPYVVDGGMLGTVSAILNGNPPDSTIEICLPDNGTSTSGGISTSYSSGDINLLWCTGESFHHNYHWDSTANSNAGGFVNTTTGKTYSLKIVQTYLAGAYYEINEDINVESGLSGSKNYTAFRGVIVGKKFTDDKDVLRYPNVTLTSSSPFIPTSNGCVLKGMNFIASSDVTLQNSDITTFDYNGGCQSYGVVIGKIMGGDNIIDEVGVTYSGSITSSTNAYIVPVGGYVGVIVNGGLFFRNMSDVENNTGLTDSNFSGGNHIGDSNKTYLYHNPIIGRVINGYAMTEAASYVPGAASQTMKNGAKNYAITDIDKTACNGGTNSSKVLNATSDAITAPDAQAWFIMSCIVNSGTGSGKNSNYKMENNISYSITDYKPTHIGTYADVGDNTKTTSTVCDSLLFKTGTGAYAEMGDKDAVTPYIIEKYTTQNGTGANDYYKHYAKSICGSARSITMGTSGTSAEWVLPDGYRGIGGLNATSGAANKVYNINVSGMTCNSTTINLNMKYQTYRSRLENYKPSDMGFGLFNTFKPSAAMTISNLTLKGNIYVDKYETDGNIYHGYRGNEYNRDYAYDVIATDKGRVSAGMFAGLKDGNNALTLSNVSIDKIDVHASRRAGGLIGYGRYITIDSCTGTNITVLGRYDTGGYIGAADESTTIQGGTSANTVFSINTISQESKGFHERLRDNNRSAGVGGLIGRFGTYDYEKGKITGTNQLTISNMNLTQYSSTTGIVQKSLQSSDESGVGGFVGTIHFTTEIRNCNATGISEIALGGNPAGVVGAAYNNKETVNFYVNSVCVDGTGAASGITYTNRYYGGGVIAKASLNSNVYVDNVQVKNYSLTKSEVGSEYKFGMLGGCIGGKPANAGGSISIRDFLVSNCTFSEPTNFDGSAGGIIGTLESGNLYGYNIAVEDISFSGKVGTYKGDIGNSNSTDRNVKIVGFSRQNTPTNTVYSGSVNNNSYIVFSDYSGTGFDGTETIEKPYLNGSTVAMVDPAKPYATLNPHIALFSGNTVLTGDGIGSSYNNLAINSIKNDLSITTAQINAATGDTKTALNNRYNKRYSTVGNITNNITSDNFTTFNTEWGANTVANDFAMLLIEDTDKNNTTNLINNYIQSITNQTKYNSFGSDVANVYSVSLYKMQLQDPTPDDNVTNYNGFTATSGAHLSRNTTKGKFYMDVSSDPDNVDSAETIPTFTLMDVEFKDPTAPSSNAAYHLYIPIYVKKLLNFSFTIGSAANTSYYSTAYSNRMLMDNLGSAGSLYFTYQYERTVSEWQDALDYGENFLKSYNKTLNMSQSGSTTVPFDNDTLIALVDANRGDKVYYARWSNVFNSGSLTMYSNNSSNFKTSVGSGTSFTPIAVNDLLNITATPNASGKFVKINTSIQGESIDYATVRIGDDYYRLKDSNDSVTDSDNYTDYYSLKVVNKAGLDTQLADTENLYLTESYYMSFFTKSTEGTTINRYNVTSPDRMSGGGSPAKASATPQALDILFGNLFEQETVTYHANYDGSNPARIDDTNNTVKVKLESTIKLTNNAEIEISSLIGNSNVYQSFLVYLTRNDSGNLTKAILGNPSAVASYTITPFNTESTLVPLTGGSAENAETGGPFAAVSKNYVEIAPRQNIASYLVDGGAKVTSYVHITYSDPSKQEAQFPGHMSDNSSEQNKYTYVTATSNIGFDPNTTALSKNKHDASNAVNTQMQYYIKSSKAPTLEYNAFADSDGSAYGQLGINALDLDDDTNKVNVKTEAVYDVSPIANDVSNYEYVKLTFELKQKSHGYYDAYGNAEVIGDYLENVVVNIDETEYTPMVYGTNSYTNAGAAATEYSFILPRSSVATDGDSNLLTIPIDFTVLTGSELQAKGKMYSNYKITVTCQMLDDDNDEVTNVQASYVTSYIIYTNAKLIKEYVTSE